MPYLRRRYSKTAAGGEIDALDPGGFGGVTIIKAITIAQEEGVGEAGILVAGTNGITVNAGANDVVVLRGLQSTEDRSVRTAWLELSLILALR